ncbi:MAG: hypothetical protein H6940_11990 [Burkholderiales bacterium]|nr:hypothetical protein [Burkholderiales bacterium]
MFFFQRVGWISVTPSAITVLLRWMTLCSSTLPDIDQSIDLWLRRTAQPGDTAYGHPLAHPDDP